MYVVTGLRSHSTRKLHYEKKSWHIVLFRPKTANEFFLEVCFDLVLRLVFHECYQGMEIELLHKNSGAKTYENAHLENG